MSNSQKMIGILGFVVVLGTGIENALAACPTFPTGFTCECNPAETEWVCAKWGAPAPPAKGSDFTVTYVSGVPDVTLSTADLGWELYSEVISSGAPADMGTLTLSDDGADDYEVWIVNGAGAGAANVGTINLTDVGFTGYSSIEGGSIGGNLTGGLTLVQDSGGNGGEITFTIDGDVSGAISVPVVKALWIFGTLSADIDVTSAIDNGTLLLDGAVASGVHITVADMVNGVIWNNPASEFNADITFGNGVPSGSGVAIHSENTSHVTYDFNNAGLGGIFQCKMDTDADFVNGGALTGTLKVGRASCFDYVGSMTFASVSATGNRHSDDEGAHR